MSWEVVEEEESLVVVVEEDFVAWGLGRVATQYKELVRLLPESKFLSDITSSQAESCEVPIILIMT